MEFLYKILLYAHITGGCIALLSGLVSMFTKKGSKPHKQAGKIFSVNMWAVILTAISISIMKYHAFLFMVGVFSLFQNYYGYRAIKNKSLKPNWLDWVILVIACLNTGLMFYSRNPILIAFGVISILLCIQQIRLYIQINQQKEIHKLTWLKQHIGMMMGTYIATVTAFLVVNSNGVFPSEYNIVVWLTPTIILTPLIIFWTKKYTS